MTDERPTKTIAVHTKSHGTLTFKGVTYCRYEAKYTNRKPTVLVLYRETWSSTDAVAEFHAADVIGWSVVQEDSA